MKKTFAITITNTSNQNYEFDLFKTEHLPEGVTINVYKSSIGYAELRRIANCKSFKGNILMTDATTPLLITYINEGYENQFTMKSFHTFLTKIVIDGNQNYLKITIPAKSKFLLQLENYNKRNNRKKIKLE